MQSSFYTLAMCHRAGRPRPYDYNGNINDNGNKKGVFLHFDTPNRRDKACLVRNKIIKTIVLKARMSLKTQVPRLSVLKNNNRGVSDVSEFRAKK